MKKLELRQLVKPVKSVNAGNVKKYMLYELQPSKEITGGPWYCDGEFDYEFISSLQMIAHGFVQREMQATFRSPTTPVAMVAIAPGGSPRCHRRHGEY